jgi:hypothetical protein
MMEGMFRMMGIDPAQIKAVSETFGTRAVLSEMRVKRMEMMLETLCHLAGQPVPAPVPSTGGVELLTAKEAA